MKQLKLATIVKTTAAVLLSAAAPHAGAQTPSPAATPKTTPHATAHKPKPAADPAATAEADQTSYLFGLTFGEQMHRAGVTEELSMAAVTRGMKDGLQGKRSTQADQQRLNTYVRSLMEAALARNQAAAKAFLASNAHETGVTSTASGLQYKIVAPGEGASPTAADEVTVQYRGKLLDGSEFDSSYARGAPAPFRVNGVIPGWQEALVLMKPGAKWQLFVPPELAYGARTQPGIPGGSLLIFDVELLSVKSGAAPTPAPAPAGPQDTPPQK